MSHLPDPLIDRVLQDTWRLEAFVARGSMGSVYRGVNTHCGTPVAIKVLNPEFLHDDEIRERFRREATVSSRCDSPHLVKVVDLVTEGDGFVGLVMEWLHGETLGAHLKHQGRLTVAETAGIIGEVGEGLHEAHEVGIIHRDLKPGNIFLAEAGRAGLLVPKIVDFGISKIVEAGADLTATATMMGTPHYMPVEQFDDSKDVDQRCDIYALGVITYELLSGTRPYRGRTPMAILNQVATAQPAPLPEDVPREVESVVFKAMAKHADDRYASVREFCNALTAVALATGSDSEARTDPSGALGLAPSTGALPALPGAHPLWRWYRRHRRPLWWGTGATLAVLVAVVLWVTLRGGGGAARGGTKGAGGTPTRDVLGRPGKGLLPPGAAARGLAVDAAGARVVAVDAAGIWRRWALPAGTRAEEHRPRVPAHAVTALALSEDGRWLALGRAGGHIDLRELRTKKTRLLPVRHPAGVAALAFSGDANRLLSGGGRGGLVVWDVRDGRVTHALTKTGAAVTAVALRGDGRVGVAGRGDGSLVTWDLVTGRPVARLAGHGRPVHRVTLHAGGARMASASADGTVRVWALPGGRLERVLRGHVGAVTAVALSEDGRLVMTGGADRTARLWTVTGERRGRMTFPGPVTQVAFGAGGALRLVAGGTFGPRLFHAAP